MPLCAGGVGHGLGGLTGGVVYSAFGAQAVFANAFLVVAAGFALCSIAHCCVARRSARALARDGLEG